MLIADRVLFSSCKQQVGSYRLTGTLSSTPTSSWWKDSYLTTSSRFSYRICWYLRFAPFDLVPVSLVRERVSELSIYTRSKRQSDCTIHFSVTSTRSSFGSVQVWKAKVFPHLRTHFASQLDSITSYFVLYHEVALTNLLEVLHLFFCQLLQASTSSPAACPFCRASSSWPNLQLLLLLDRNHHVGLLLEMPCLGQALNSTTPAEPARYSQSFWHGR